MKTKHNALTAVWAAEHELPLVVVLLSAHASRPPPLHSVKWRRALP
jgi:hypothetical protein